MFSVVVSGFGLKQALLWVETWPQKIGLVGGKMNAQLPNSSWFLLSTDLRLVPVFHFPTSNHLALCFLGFYFQISPYATVKHFSAKINCFTCAL